MKKQIARNFWLFICLFVRQWNNKLGKLGCNKIEPITPQSLKIEEIVKEKEKSSPSLTKPRSPKMDKSLAQEVVTGSRPGSSNEKVDGKEAPIIHPATVPTARKTDKDKVDVENQKELLQQHFSQLFELPDEKLTEDYACALQDKLALIHGRMYISDHYVCFASTIFKQTMKKISFKDITGLYKKNTAIVFPNAIEIHTKDQRLFFMSFIFRDQCFHSLWVRWEAAKKEISQQIRSVRNSAVSHRGNKKKGADSDDSNSDNSENSDSDSDSDEAKDHDSDDSEEDVDQQEDDADSDDESEEDDEASSKNSSHSTGITNASLDTSTAATQPGAANTATRTSLGAVDTSKVKTDSDVGYRMVKRRSNSWSSDLIRKTMDESAAKPATDNNNNNNETTDTTNSETTEHFTTLPVIDVPCKHLGQDEAGHDYYINEFYPVSVAQFFHTLLSDKSEFWVNVNLVHDYTDNVCSNWTLDEAKCCYVRNMAFTSPVNAVIGPKSTRVTATQRIRFNAPDHFSFDHLSVSKDVPYGDTFYIVTRYEVTKKGNGCMLQVATAVKFTKTVWGMKGMIERLSTDSSRNFNQKFATMAKEKFPAPATPPTPIAEKPKVARPKAVKSTKPKKRTPAAQPEAPKPATSQSLVSTITELTSSPLVSDIVRAIYLLLLFILFVLVFSQYSTIAHLNDQLTLTVTAAGKAENKILFLQHFVETVVRNVTGVEGTLKEQWVLWQSHKELLNKLDGYKIQMDLLKSEIEKTQHMLGDLELEGLNADKVFEDATPTSVFAFLFKMAVLGAIAYAVYWAILNKDMILQTMSGQKKTPAPQQTPHSKTE